MNGAGVGLAVHAGSGELPDLQHDLLTDLSCPRRSAPGRAWLPNGRE